MCARRKVNDLKIAFSVVMVIIFDYDDVFYDF